MASGKERSASADPVKIKKSAKETRNVATEGQITRTKKKKEKVDPGMYLDVDEDHMEGNEPMNTLIER